MSDVIQKILQEVDNLTDEMVQMCQSLVKINTVSPYAGAGPTGLEKPGQEFLKPILEKMGGKTHMFEPPADIYKQIGIVGPKDRSWKGRPNLVTRFDLGPGKRIIVNAHMDTVDVLNMDIDPFSGEVKDGKIYGRGTSDDKGGMAMGITAIKAVLKFADKLAGTIIHESVADEECSGVGAGTLACCLEGYKADQAIVLDGGGLVVVRGCHGCLTADVTVQGRSGHAAAGGINAIDKACLIKQAIDQFKVKRESQNPQCLVNLGVFKAGSHPAVVPAEAMLSINLVYSIEEAAASEKAGQGWNASMVRKQFLEMISKAEQSDQWMRDNHSKIVWSKDALPYSIPKDDMLVQDFSKAYQDTLGSAPDVQIMSGWADGSNLFRFGQTPAILFGPGSKGVSHSMHETVEIQDLINGAKVVAVHLYQQLAKNN